MRPTASQRHLLQWLDEEEGRSLVIDADGRGRPEPWAEWEPQRRVSGRTVEALLNANWIGALAVQPKGRGKALHCTITMRGVIAGCV